jgi:hypothetical protein
MRLLMQRFLAVSGSAQLVDGRRQIVEAFSAQEEAVARAAPAAAQPQMLVQGGMGVAGGKPQIAAAASGLKPQAMAIASSRVDLPEPFSPTRNVTGWSNAMSRKL